MSLERLLTSSYLYHRELARILLKEKIIPNYVHIDNDYLTLGFSRSFCVWMYEEEYFCHLKHFWKSRIRVFDIALGVVTFLYDPSDIIDYIRRAEDKRNLLIIT